MSRSGGKQLHDGQAPIFDYPKARWSDPTTSREAAESISFDKLTRTQELVLFAFRALGPSTDEELVRAFRERWPSCRVSPQSIRSRRAELRRRVWSSIPASAGWPDLALCRPPRFLAVELKARRGRLSPEQVRWLEDLSRCNIETYCWRAGVDSLQDISRVLRGTP